MRTAVKAADKTDAGSARSAPQDRISLANRFDDRAKRLRRQANVLLTIIIFVLIAGAAGFVFANDIASLNFGPQTAASQYTAALAAWKKKVEEEKSVEQRISETQDSKSIAKPFNDQITSVKSSFVDLEEKELAQCKDITFVRKSPSWQKNELQVLFSQERIGEYQFATVDRVIFFSNGAAATECKDRLAHNLDAELISHTRKIQDITRERDAAVDEFVRGKEQEV